MSEPSEPVPSRQLVIHVLLSLLVSVAVFAVLSYATLVPRIVHHEKRIQELEAQLAQQQEEAEEAAEAAAAPATAPAPAPAAAVPAVAK
ncbi:MAG: hypothetical protein ACXWLM_10075 [Myxococcales bacterium]